MKIFHSILLSFWLFLPLGAVQASDAFPLEIISSDTVKYRGYRLELYNFELVKKTDNWVRVRFSAVNTGRMDIKMEDATMHWVQLNFDPSLFEKKLGGYREHIKYQLAKDGFRLGIGELREKVDLKFPAILPAEYRKAKSEPIAKKKKIEKTVNEASGFNSPKTAEEDLPVHPEMTGKGGGATGETVRVSTKNKSEKNSKACPDIRFENLRIVKEDDKWVTVEYTIVNDGEGVFHLIESEKGRDDGLVVRAYISGVSTLSRGALPIGGAFVEAGPGVKNELKKGETYKAQLKLDVRKKTRYMKSLILKLDGGQYAKECDRKNNTSAVILR